MQITSTDIERIKSKIEELKSKPNRQELFGAGNEVIKTGHYFKMNPTLSKDAIEKIEQRWDIELPEDYKMYISEIANGGLGPFYGLNPLEADPDKQQNYLEDTICLSHEGCGYFHHLGVKGDKKGRLFVDLRNVDEGVVKIEFDSFLQWLEAWLDNSIQSLS